MAKFPIHSVENAADEARSVLRAVEETFGFVPNLIGTLAAAPIAARAYVHLYGLLREGTLTGIEREVVLTTASVANGCDYCVAAHTWGLRANGAGDDLVDAVREGRSLADPKLETLRRFVTAVVDTRGRVTRDAVDEFLRAGFLKGQVFEVLVGVALKTLSNYANHIAETPLDKSLEPFAWSAVEA